MRLYFAIIIFALPNLSLCIEGADTVAQALTNQQLVQSGREAFLNRCSGCHGETADGNGPAAPMLSPKPRNLVTGLFKFRSTPSGVLPTVSDLLRTLDQGIPGSAMPPFKELSSQEKLSLVAYIRSLRPEFSETKSDQQSLAIPAPPNSIFSKKLNLLSAAKRGKLIFAKGCLNCHGASGKGDGPSAEGLTDSYDQPIRPANLNMPELKSGKTARDLFKVMSTGLDGSPMPSYTEVFTEAQRWDVVAFIFYLRGKTAGIYTEKDSIE